MHQITTKSLPSAAAAEHIMKIQEFTNLRNLRIHPYPYPYPYPDILLPIPAPFYLPYFLFYFFRSLH